jgi:hypothetical protein
MIEWGSSRQDHHQSIRLTLALIEIDPNGLIKQMIIRLIIQSMCNVDVEGQYIRALESIITSRLDHYAIDIVFILFVRAYIL